MPFGRYRGLLATYLGPQRRGIVLLVLLLCGGIALDLAGPQIIRVFLDAAVSHTALGLLLIAGGIFLATALMRQLAAIAETYMAERVGWTATNAIRADLTRHCLSLDRAFHQAHTPGELIERIDGDVTTLANFFARLVIQLAANVLVLLGVVILCFVIDWRVGLALALFSLVSLALLYRMRDAGVAQWGTARQASADLFGFIEERLSGTEDIRAFGATNHVLRQLAQRTRALLLRQRRAGAIGSVTFNTLLVLLAIGTAGSLGLGGYLYATHVISIGTVFLIYSYTGVLQRPIEDMTRQLQEVQEATASMNRVQQLLATKSALPEGTGMMLPSGALSVGFDHATFAYADGTDAVLRDLTFDLAAGKTLGIVGRTGSGKTTLARLLFRLYDVTGGSVCLGGVDVRAPYLAELREHIGMVTQDIQLFHASVRDNLTFFDPAIPDERINAILVELGMERWLRGLPDGLNTMLAADGSGLSAGEAQLLAFARVFLRDPGLVILDEASSRLDLATEQVIERAIDRLMADRTGVIIAHRLATLQRADMILLLEDGHIVEYGPREVLARDPASRFARLLRVGMAEALA